MLAVTGASGQVGGRVAARLANLGRKQRLIVRDPAQSLADYLEKHPESYRHLMKRA